MKYQRPKVFDKSLAPKKAVDIALSVRGLKHWKKGVMLLVRLRGRDIQLMPIT